MGLFWSMTLDTSNEKDYRYMKRDVTTPQVVQFSIFDGHIPRNCNLIKPLFTTALHRWFLRKGVSREEIRIGKLRGTIFIPEGAGPFPGVIDVFSSVGGLIESRASLLASRGFVTYALPYFSFEDLPKRMNDMEFEYFKETVDWFSKHPMVMKNGIGTCGVSKGGELALMLAVQCPQVKAVVNVNGSPFCSYGPLPPFTDYVKSDESAYKLVNGGYSVKLGLTNNFTPDKMFKLWELDAKILYIVGEDDLTYDPMYADALYKCYPEDQRHKLIIKKYPKAGHLIEPPYNPICVSSYHNVFGLLFAYGGTTADHIRADEDSWQATQDFFKRTLSSYQIRILMMSKDERTYS